MSSWQARPAWQLPVQWPDGAIASDRGRVVRERLLKAAILFAILALTVLDHFGLKLGEKESIPVSMMAMYALVAAMLLAGAAQLNFRAALAYLALVSVATISVLLNVSYTPSAFVSKMSLVFLVVAYAPFCVSLRQGAVAPELWRWTLSLFIAFAVFIGVAGIVQFFAQFVFKPAWLFDFRVLLPEPLRLSGYNTEYEIYSSTGEEAFTKSNGFFMREPSIFSGMIALGFLCELSLSRRRWVMAILAAGLAVSHAAGGLVCLAAGLLFTLGRSNLTRAAVFGVLAAAVIFLLRDTQNVQVYLKRTNELNSPNTSGYCRLVAPAVEVVRHIDRAPWTSLVGNGPGSFTRLAADDCTPPVDTTYAKAMLEYGLVGTLALGVVILGALNRSSASVGIRVGTLVAWLLLGSLFHTQQLLFMYIVSAMWPEGTVRALRDPAPSVPPGPKSRQGYT